MNKKIETHLSDKLAQLAVIGMQEKKGNDIKRLDMRGVNATLSDYFVICHADSTTQVNAIAKSVEEEVYKALGQEPWHKEGHGNGEWLLLDFVDVVIHIFKTETRSRYRIEDLWGDAQVETYQSA
ncbi:ribosome silencing factor [Sphingobacterium sp. UT-1RO-CII-1]|uniref:ribosome silencing factor n=1 Tax=Sphingobacterium sp. UT-1RO-CII-1 TaxID=2995225 RepID=UPI00227A4C6F|nr:ribosome silencing factor [Sphingobacterium sp. UT-1RO-CII-1]MCY4780860.1 ribosome silencing factor [Sphingobacterium sp. UT-1RO-CII-1]